MADYEFVWPLSDAHLTEMGRVIVESASLEQTLQLAIWQLLNLPEEYGSQITGRMHLDPRATLFNKIATTRFTTDADRTELASVMEAIRDVIPKRNDIAHGLWWEGTDIGEAADLYRYKESDNEYGLRYRSLTPSNIYTYAAEISAANDKLIAFMNQRGAVPPPPPRKPPTRY